MLSNEDAVRAFAAGRSGNSKNVFHDDHGRLYSYGHHFILAVRLKDGNYLINGDTYSPSTSRHTSLCIQSLKPNVIMPFSALTRVVSDYSEIVPIHREPDNYIMRTRRDPKTGALVEYTEHRLGSFLFSYENRHYLSSIDTGAKGNGGYFLVELPEPATTVEGAFDALLPLDLDKSLPYVRQGEFFFVPANIPTRDLTPAPELYEWGLYNYETHCADRIRRPTKEEAQNTLDRNLLSTPWMVHRFPIKDQGNLARRFPGSGTGHAHNVTELRYFGDRYFVRGSIRHPEHKTLHLGKIWHQVYVNRAVRSFNAIGNVD